MKAFTPIPLLALAGFANAQSTISIPDRCAYTANIGWAE